MHDINQQLGDGIVLVFVLQFFGIIFLDSALQKSRIICRLGKTGGVMNIWPGRGVDLSGMISYGTWLVYGILQDLLDYHRAQTYRSLSLQGKVAFAALFTVMFLYLAFAFRFQLRLRALNDFRVLRGQLYTAVSKLSKICKFLGLQGVPLYVIPDQDFEMLCVRAGSGVVLPRRLLDQLTRNEIDALAARQLCLQSRKSYFSIFWILLICNIVVVSLGQWFHIVPIYSFLLYTSLLVLEMFALNRYSPRMLFMADLRAIQLTGDAEAFFTALGSLSRFTGVPPSESLLLELGRVAAVSPGRIKELLAEHETKSEDRYPTTGSYMDTGL
jgi:Zn-dependent protease with chaperone function